MTRHRSAILALALAALILSATASAAEPPAKPVPLTRKAIDDKIAEMVAGLWKAVDAEGDWDLPKRPPPGDPNAKTGHSNYGGDTALSLLALKVAGADEQEARFAKPLALVDSCDGNGTYFRALRAVLYSMLKDPNYEKLLMDDARFLGRGLVIPKGIHTYVPWDGKTMADSTYGDFSNNQYAILGIWIASDHGFEVPLKYWHAVEKGYLDHQAPDGGWGYYPTEKQGYGSMTASALASLFVIWEKAYVVGDANCSGKVNKDLVESINRGLDWLGKNFSATQNPGKKDWNDGYYFHTLERVGVASGLKYIGTHDWYREVAEALINKRATPYGPRQQAWTLMFLCYGRAPVAFNKLKYGPGWNEHPREFAMLCKYLAMTYEKHHNWQVLPIEAGADEFHDAPILAMSGRTGVTLKPDQAAKIRTYLLRGGLLFGEAIGGSPAFAASFKTLCQQMFPNFELVRLGPEHPIYSASARLAGGQPELLGLSDGVRTLVVFSPREISCDWQKMNVVSGKARFDLGSNLVAYASDGGQLWSKEESYWPTDAGNKPARTIQVGRLVYGDAKAEHVWNPTEGAGWQRLDIVSRNRGGPGVATVPTDLAQPLDATRTPLLHVTGIGAITLTDQAKANLKAYVESGGLLLADAAGGKAAFAEGFTKLMAELFGANKLLPPPADQVPFLQQAGDNGKLWHRHLDKLPRSLRVPELLAINVPQKGGASRLNVLFLPRDLTYALDGAPASDPVGLDPAAAEKLMLAVLSWRTGVSLPTTSRD